VLYIWAARRSKLLFASELIELDGYINKYIDRHQCMCPHPLAVHAVWLLWNDGLFGFTVLWWREQQ
jgi:hypothetical protein